MKNGVCLKCGVNAFLRIYQGADEGFTHSVKKTNGLPGLGILKYGNTISLSVECMRCPPIPPPLSGHSQSDTRWQWLGYRLVLAIRDSGAHSGGAVPLPATTISRCFRVWNLWTIEKLKKKSEWNPILNLIMMLDLKKKRWWNKTQFHEYL